MAGHLSEGSTTYIYIYIAKGKVIYVGKGSMGDNFKRAEDLKGHAGIDPSVVNAIHIKDFCSDQDQKYVEQYWIDEFGGLEILDNRRNEISASKYHQKTVEYHARRKVTRTQIDKNEVKGARGAATAEKADLSNHIINTFEKLVSSNFENNKIFILGNGGYGNLNMTKTLIKHGMTDMTLANTKFNHNKELVKMTEDNEVNYQVINGSYLDKPLNKNTIKLSFMNPPWGKDKVNKSHNGAQDFIGKVALETEIGGYIVAISNTTFAGRKANKNPVPGTYKWLVENGEFIALEYFKEREDGIYFPTVGDRWCWFIWKKGKTETPELTHFRDNQGGIHKIEITNSFPKNPTFEKSFMDLETGVDINVPVKTKNWQDSQDSQILWKLGTTGRQVDYLIMQNGKLIETNVINKKTGKLREIKDFPATMSKYQNSDLKVLRNVRDFVFSKADFFPFYELNGGRVEFPRIKKDLIFGK